MIYVQIYTGRSISRLVTRQDKTKSLILEVLVFLSFCFLLFYIDCVFYTK